MTRTMIAGSEVSIIYSFSSLLSFASFSPANIFWISLSDLPLVSGTRKKTKTVPTIDKPEKSQNVCPSPIAVFKLTKVFVMTNAEKD